MRVRLYVSAACAYALAACAAGSPAPPSLAYRLPAVTDVTYDVLDTATVGIEALGQTLELEVGSAAVYGVSFSRAGEGVRVTLSVEDLAATVAVPMAGPIEVDESSITGDLVFTLDRLGQATMEAAPEVEEAIGQLMPPLQVANSFFPALPGRPVRAGDSWTDTISYGGDGSAGNAAASESTGTQRSVIEYTAVGDTVIAGTSLLRIAFDGVSEVSQTLTMQGAEIEQSTDLELEGHVLWDAQAGVMFERRTVSIGTGTVRIALMPAELPTRFESVTHVRLRRE
jgi:hypothetical protein